MIPLPPVQSRKLGKRNEVEHTEKRLTERHFPAKIPAAEGRKRKVPSRPCAACNRLQNLEVELQTKRTSFWCPDCEKPLCITPCFGIYHTKRDYKRVLTEIRTNPYAVPIENSPQSSPD